MELYWGRPYSLDVYAAGAEMTDIVERLRTVDISWSQEGEWCAEAADEIVRLREALKKICHVTGSDMEAYDIAENALKGGE